jgi:SAM-dependent methyltransferase
MVSMAKRRKRKEEKKKKREQVNIKVLVADAKRGDRRAMEKLKDYYFLKTFKENVPVERKELFRGAKTPPVTPKNLKQTVTKFETFLKKYHPTMQDIKTLRVETNKVRSHPMTDERIAAYHDKVSKHFFGSATPAQIYKEMMKDVLKELQLKGDEKIMSIGSGTGHIETFLAKNIIPKGKIVGFDNSKGMVEEAQRIAQKEKVKNVSFYKENASNLEKVKNEHFDHILALDSLSFVTDYPKAAEQIADKLRKNPKARFIFSLGAFGAEAADHPLIMAKLRKRGIEVEVLKTIDLFEPVTNEILGSRVIYVTKPKKKK